MVAWADGLNFYLYKHPGVKPRVITHFEPWMALSFTEGSIGGDIETVNLAQLAGFLRQGAGEPARANQDERRTGTERLERHRRSLRRTRWITTLCC